MRVMVESLHVSIKYPEELATIIPRTYEAFDVKGIVIECGTEGFS